MPTQFTISTEGTKVTIGEGYSTENKLAIGITNMGATASVRVTVTARYGTTGDALLADKNALVTATCAQGEDKKPIDDAPSKRTDGDDKLVWQTMEFGIPVSTNGILWILLKGFESNTPAGDALVDVVVDVLKDDDDFDQASAEQLHIKKEVLEPTEPKIHYFTVTPDYILHAGQADVWVDFYATGFTSVVLYRNNQEVQVWKKESDGEPIKDSDGDVGIVGEFPRGKYLFKVNDFGEDPLVKAVRDRFKHGQMPLSANPQVARFIPPRKWVIDDGATRYRIRKEQGELNVYGGSSIFEQPSITTVYRLVGKVDESVTKTVNQTVHVISPGWNQITLPQGYPARLFVNQDFDGSGMERLYGIFIDGRDKAALYSSGTGVDDWREEPDPNNNFPQHMATSPGVSYKNNLWLIGGSSVDSNLRGAEVWCYEKLDNVREWRQHESFPRKMPARAGHACVVVPRKTKDEHGKDIIVEELWVIGGYSGRKALNDVWKLEGKTWVAIKEDVTITQGNKEIVPGGRLMHAAVSFRPHPTRPAQVWIYGGADVPDPELGLTDLWVTENGKEWMQVFNAKKYEITPQPGAPLGAALVSYEGTRGSHAPGVASLQPQRLFLGGTFLDAANGGNRIASFIFEWQWRTMKWETRPIGDGWEQFGGNAFYMQAIAFNRFLFVWSLNTAIKASAPPKLNILIPS
ncbi:hypothetical protein D1AOALGA4SA_6388 [Olavius algarvensis Delta 1 endosymbiont]|nr:hypothetical protein D1AOALGA4SA_6388 [Olavius algarvensis Delta 1 endosymbiont]